MFPTSMSGTSNQKQIMSNFNIGKGFALEITLSNGKKKYTSINSYQSGVAERLGLQTKTVQYKGCCICVLYPTIFLGVK